MLNEEMINERKNSLLNDLNTIQSKMVELEKRNWKLSHCRMHLQVLFNNVTIFLIKLIMTKQKIWFRVM